MAINVEKRLKAELCFILLLCVVAVVAEVMAYFSALKPEGELTALWFQRSGAITAIFSAFAQFRINSFLESIRGGTFAESWALYRQFIRRQVVISWIVTILALWGAIVWGYGDLIFKALHEVVAFRSELSPTLTDVFAKN